MKFTPDVAEGANDSPRPMGATLSLANVSGLVSRAAAVAWRGCCRCRALQQPGFCLHTGLASHSGELFSEGRISAAALCLWGTTVTTHVAHSFSLSTNIPQKGGGGGEFWSPGEIKLSFNMDIKLSVKLSLWKWMY